MNINELTPSMLAAILERDLGPVDIVPAAPGETGDFPTEATISWPTLSEDGVTVETFDVSYDAESDTYGGTV